MAIVDCADCGRPISYEDYGVGSSSADMLCDDCRRLHGLPLLVSHVIAGRTVESIERLSDPVETRFYPLTCSWCKCSFGHSVYEEKMSICPDCRKKIYTCPTNPFEDEKKPRRLRRSKNPQMSLFDRNQFVDWS